VDFLTTGFLVVDFLTVNGFLVVDFLTTGFLVDDFLTVNGFLVVDFLKKIKQLIPIALLNSYNHKVSKHVVSLCCYSIVTKLKNLTLNFFDKNDQKQNKCME
jgi:hypothetical protein